MEYNSEYIKDNTLDSFYNKVREESKNTVIYSMPNDIVKDNIDMHTKKYEVFRILFLDNANKKIETMEFKGISNQCALYVSRIMRKALDIHATSIVIMHNHPGKSCNFSDTDLKITRKVYVACISMELKLLDHILFYGEGHKSICNSPKWYEISKSIY